MPGQYEEMDVVYTQFWSNSSWCVATSFDQRFDVFLMLVCKRIKRIKGIYPILALSRDCLHEEHATLFLFPWEAMDKISYFWQQRARVNWG